MRETVFERGIGDPLNTIEWPWTPPVDLARGLLVWTTHGLP